MPVLDNEHYEIFAQEKARGTLTSTAYAIAFPANEMSMAVLRAAGGRLMMRDDVRARIRELQTEAALEVGVTIWRVLQGWANIGFADIRDVVTWKDGRPSLVDADRLSPEQAAAIAEISETEKGLKVKFHSKTAALDSMAKFLGIHKEQLELTGKDGGPIEIKDDVDLARRIAFILARAGAKEG